MAITTTTLKLCSIPELSIDYTNTLDFANITNQINFFTSRLQRSFVSKISTDSTKQTIIIEADLNEINNCDYLFFSDAFGKIYFYFITSKKYKTSSTTELFLELDVYQTYLFDFTLKDSFVDRCHVNRWTSNGYPAPNNIIEEGLEFGEHIITKIDKLYPLGSNYLITATNPLGTLGENTPPITDDEKEINREFGFNPSNPIPEWPSDNGDNNFPDQPDEIPDPVPDTGSTPNYPLSNKDYIGFNHMTTVSAGTGSNSSTITPKLPISSGEYGLTFPNSEEEWIDRIGKDYMYGNFIYTKNYQPIYPPFVSIRKTRSIETTWQVMEIGNGIPTHSSTKTPSTTNTADKYILRVNYGNFIILRYTTYYYPGSTTGYGYCLIGFMQNQSTLTVGQSVKLNTVLGNTGDISFLNGENHKGLYIKFFNDHHKTIQQLLKPFDERVKWTGFKFGAGMYDKTPGNLENFTKTNELFGTNVYIPCRIGNKSTVSGWDIVQNLTSNQNVNTYLVAPTDCLVIGAGIKAGENINLPFVNVAMNGVGNTNSDIYNYVMIKMGSYTMLITGLSFINVKAGDIVEKGNIIGTYNYYWFSRKLSQQNLMPITVFQDVTTSTSLTRLQYLEEYPSVGNPTATKTPQWGILTTEQLLLKDKEELDNIYKEKVLSDSNLIPLLNVLNQEEKIE